MQLILYKVCLVLVNETIEAIFAMSKYLIFTAFILCPCILSFIFLFADDLYGLIEFSMLD